MTANWKIEYNRRCEYWFNFWFALKWGVISSRNWKSDLTWLNMVFSGFQDQQRVLQLLNHVVDRKMSHQFWLISEEITLESITKKCKPIYWDYIPGILGISIPMNGSWIHIHWFENLLSSSKRFQNGHHFMGFSGRKSFLKNLLERLRRWAASDN